MLVVLQDSDTDRSATCLSRLLDGDKWRACIWLGTCARHNDSQPVSVSVCVKLGMFCGWLRPR